MSKYIRMHKVEAEPMKFGEFKEKYPKSGGANVERGANDDGYVIFYRGGEYVSWCPKKEFEDVSRPCDGMTFGEAIEAMKRGKKVARKGWNGEGQFVRFETVLAFDDGVIHLEEDGAAPATESECFVFHYKNRHTGETGIQVGWLASQADMKAEDWKIVE